MFFKIYSKNLTKKELSKIRKNAKMMNYTKLKYNVYTKTKTGVTKVKLVTEKMGWAPDKQLSVTGQTYPRIVDAQILYSLAVVAATAHKFATDLRLLANRGELEEPFEKKQIGCRFRRTS